MTNLKRIGFVAVSVVMASSMLVGCGTKVTSSNKTSSGITNTWNVEINESIYGDKLYAEGTTLNMNVGYKATNAYITFKEAGLSGTVTLADGKTYTAGQLKPAWQGASDQLGINFNDTYLCLGSDAQVETPISEGTINDHDIITASSTAIVNSSSYFLNLNEYLEYMPNYVQFLKDNPVTLYSLTSDTDTGAMYYAPYFDGNNDIEKYVMTNLNWVTKMLDASDVSAATTTFAEQASAKSLDGSYASVTSKWGTTGSWTVETTSPDESSTGYVKVDYDAALTAAKDSSTELGKALSDAGVTISSLTSGNIVDLQNAAIDAKAGAVTGAQLIAILKAYIKTAYTYSDTENGSYSQIYGTTLNVSDVFISASAAWDVDLLTALLRCSVTSIGLYSDDVNEGSLSYLYGLTARQGVTQRRVDLLSFCGELYGVRGMESRLEYSYINSDGQYVDARGEEESWEALGLMSAYATEGLMYTGTTVASGKWAYAASGSIQALMVHDYAQTQTTQGFTDTDTSSYNIAPIVTPVAKWNDGSGDTMMRFTESWRSVKNTGICLNASLADAGNEDKLYAALAFIDYLFSSDGQIMMTYGTQSSSNTNPDGWWYANEQTNVSVSDVADVVAEATGYLCAQYEVKSEYKSQYFVYNGKVYTGTSYNGKQIPTMTDNNLSFFHGNEVNGTTLGSTDFPTSAKDSFTNYARYVIGSTLPLGNKDQGFEYQCTAQCALDGAATVSIALNNGTLKHVVTDIEDLPDANLWYLCVPTTLPVTSADQAKLNGDTQTQLGVYFQNSSSTYYNAHIDVLFFGFDTTKSICQTSTYANMLASASAYADWYNNTIGGSVRTAIYSEAWDALAYYYGLVG